MATTMESDVTLQLTLTLPKIVVDHIRDEVGKGRYRDEREYIEMTLLSEALFEPVDHDELTHWINTEGVRRLKAMEADPSRGLTHEEFFAALGIDDDESEER